MTVHFASLRARLELVEPSFASDHHKTTGVVTGWNWFFAPRTKCTNAHSLYINMQQFPLSRVEI
jgi:hypothetical protein